MTRLLHGSGAGPNLHGSKRQSWPQRQSIRKIRSRRTARKAKEALEKVLESESEPEDDADDGSQFQRSVAFLLS
eukprot:SAG22_NODE_681_length_7933_cov_27.729257_8_plen_74_part_00